MVNTEKNNTIDSELLTVTLSLTKGRLLRNKTIKKLSIPIAIILFFLLSMISCQGWGWEPIETDLDSKLNILGLIAVDDSMESFIIVHKSLPTKGSDQVLIGFDTVYYYVYDKYDEKTDTFFPDTSWSDTPIIYPKYESAYMVKNAEVIVSDGVNSWTFLLSSQINEQVDLNNNYLRDPQQDLSIYLSEDSSFIAKANQKYTLTVSTPDGMSITATTTTPSKPVINESTLKDTFSSQIPYTVKWKNKPEYNSVIRTFALPYNYCGTDNFEILTAEDSIWTSSVDTDCYEWVEDDDQENTLNTTAVIIKLRFLDESYYKYFFEKDSDMENVNNFLLGEGSIGVSYGIEGGYGVFGSFTSTYVTRPFGR